MADPPQVDLSGKRVAVAGGASGIGAAYAQRLVAAGARVVVVDRDPAGAARVASAVGGEPLVLDLADTGRRAALDLAADVLVTNAGLQHVAPMGEFSRSASPTSSG